MPQSPDYAELVAQAERAVASVRDPELKRAAFEKILEDLLGSPRGSHVAPAPGKRSPRSAASTRERPAKKKRGPQAYVEELVNEGFFKKPKTIAQVKAELENRGHHIPLTSLSGPLQKLCQRRKLRRHKAKAADKKQAYNYSNW